MRNEKLSARVRALIFLVIFFVSGSAYPESASLDTHTPASGTPTLDDAWKVFSGYNQNYNRIDETVAMTEEILKRDPDNPDYLVGQGDAWVKLGDLPRGLESARRGVDRGLTTVRLLYSAARVFAQAGKKLPPNDPELIRVQREAVGLLAAALRRIEADQFEKFWRDFVEKDIALASLLRLPAVARLREQVHFP